MYATEQQKKILLDAVEALEAHPEQLDMDRWLYKTESCGTVCCLAGQICLNARYTPAWHSYTYYHPDGRFVASDVFINEEDVYGAGEAARMLIGRAEVNADEDELFFRRNWPVVFDNDYDKAKSGKRRVAALRARVEHWIDTGN